VRALLDWREHVERAGLAELELVGWPGRARRLVLEVGQGRDPSGRRLVLVVGQGRDPGEAHL
jgi:hypothetical protein